MFDDFIKNCAMENELHISDERIKAQTNSVLARIETEVNMKQKADEFDGKFGVNAEPQTVYIEKRSPLKTIIPIAAAAAVIAVAVPVGANYFGKNGALINESSVISTISAPLSSKPANNTDSSEPLQSKLEDELKKEIETWNYVKFNSMKASNCGHVVDYYRYEGNYFTGDDDPLNFIKSSIALVAERDKDGRLISFGSVSAAGWAEGAFTPMKYSLQYNTKDKRAYFYTFSKNEILPKLEIFEDTDEKRFYEIMGIEYGDSNEKPTVPDDGLPYDAIEDLDVIVLSKYPLITYPKSSFTQSDGRYIADFVRCADTAAMNVKYNDINSVKNADDFDDKLRYWGDKKLTENYDPNSAETYTKEIRAGDRIGGLTVRSCSSTYPDGVKESEDGTKYYNYITGPIKTEMIFDGEVTLTGYAFREGERVVFIPYADSVSAAFPVRPPDMVCSRFAGCSDYENTGSDELVFVYSALDNTYMDITGSFSADFGGALVKEVEVTISSPELYSEKNCDSNKFNGIYGTVTAVKDKGTVL